MANGCDVVVIGAGFAGAVAARDLGVAGHSVVLLEARDRVGGTCLDAAFGSHADFGGTYVHWTQPLVWRELRRHHIELWTHEELPVAAAGGLGAFLDSAVQRPIKGGVKRLLDAILGESKAELRLSSPVSAVEDIGSGVVVTTRAGERFPARAAVLALSLDTLSEVTVTPEVTVPVREAHGRINFAVGDFAPMAADGIEGALASGASAARNVAAALAALALADGSY